LGAISITITFMRLKLTESSVKEARSVTSMGSADRRHLLSDSARVGIESCSSRR